MHPFLPVLSLVLLGMADAASYFLWKYGSRPEIAMHQPSLLAVIGLAFFFGGGLAYWLKRFRIRFALYFAAASAAAILGLLLQAKA